MANRIEYKHDTCRFFYTREEPKTKYSKNGIIHYPETIDKCGLNPLSVVLDKEQPVCMHHTGKE